MQPLGRVKKKKSKLSKVQLAPDQIMRPDEHKKKRSAQYNKKKGNQDGKKDNQTGSKTGSEKDFRGRGKIASTTQQQHQRPVVQKVDSSDSSSDSQSPDRKDRKQTFQRRQIVSNWSRYEASNTNTDQVPPIAKDYSKLLNTAGGTGGASSHFRFKDETDWDLSSEGDVQPSSLLAIDLSHLASALDSIPLYERLAIPPHLFTEEQRKTLMEEADRKRKEYEEMCQSDSKLANSAVPVTAPVDVTAAQERGSSAKKKTTPKNNLFSAAMKADQTATVDTFSTSLRPKGSETNIKGDSSVDSDNKLNKVDLKTTKSPLKIEGDKSLQNAADTQGSKLKSENNSSVVIPASQEEDLDFLLSLGAKGTTTTNIESNSIQSTCTDKIQTHSESNENKNVCQKISDSEENTSLVQAEKAISNSDKSKVKMSKSEDLEDWLDNFLDE